MLTPNNIEGSFAVEASAAGVADSLQFALTNTDATAPVLNLQVVAGGGQSAVVGAAFAEVIWVKLLNGQGESVAGRVLSFSIPATHAPVAFIDPQ